jgi:hypothetical protein
MCPLCGESKFDLHGRCIRCRFPRNPVLIQVGVNKDGSPSFRMISNEDFEMMRSRGK